jgi:hypothetical protein
MPEGEGRHLDGRQVGGGGNLPPESVSAEPRLLEEASTVLGSTFEVRHGSLSMGAPWLLAENAWFLLGVVAGTTLEDLRVLEDFAADELGELASDDELGAKRWDTHLVLLAAQDIDVGSGADAAAIQNDLRAMRRIIATGVAAEPRRLQAALASFLPLPASSTTTAAPLAELEAALVINGVAEEDAALAVAAFQQSGDLDAL